MMNYISGNFYSIVSQCSVTIECMNCQFASRSTQAFVHRSRVHDEKIVQIKKKKKTVKMYKRVICVFYKNSARVK